MGHTNSQNDITERFSSFQEKIYENLWHILKGHKVNIFADYNLDKIYK